MKRKRCGYMNTDRLGILVKKAALKLDKTAAPILAPYDLMRFINSMNAPMSSTIGRMYAIMNSSMGDISAT